MIHQPSPPATTAPDVSGVDAQVRESTYIVIAAYNEGQVLADVIRGVLQRYPNVVVVDDGSTDDTYDVARGVAPHVLRHPVNRGQGAALQTGITFALHSGAQYVVTFDADGQHQPANIDHLLAPLVAGKSEIALGSRFLGEAAVNMPRMRSLLLRGGVLFTRVFSGVALTDTHNGFRAFTRRAAEKINIQLDRMAHASEIIDQVHHSGLPYQEVPVEIHYTEWSMHKGQSSRGAARIAFEYLLGKMIR